MPVRVFEDVASRAWEVGADNLPKRGTLLYIAIGTADRATALSAVQGAAPALYGGLAREAVRVEPEPDTIDETADDGVWRGEASYVKKDLQTPATGDFTTRFSTLGGTQHITQSLEPTVDRSGVPGGGLPPDFHGAIGVTDDNVEGVDLEVPVYNWTETHYLPDATVTPAYRGRLFVMTGAMNNAPFKDCEVGECLFRGATGAKRGQGDWEMSFEFGASPNLVAKDVGTSGLVITKLGWDYVWFRYRDREDLGAAGKVVKIAFAAYVERLRKFKDFSLLGIGT